MGKLKKVLLLVLALCVMISIMSIAATATGTEDLENLTWDFTVSDSDFREGITQLDGFGVGNIAAGYLNFDCDNYYVIEARSTDESIVSFYAPKVADGWEYDLDDDDVWDKWGNLYLKGNSAGVALIEQKIAAKGDTDVLLTVYLTVVVGDETYVSPTEVYCAEGHSHSITLNDTLNLTAVVAPDNASVKSVTWTSSDETIATVTQDGLVATVTPLTAGTVHITATSNVPNYHSADCTVTVLPYPQASVTKSTNDKDMNVVGFDSILGGSNVYGTVKPLPKWTFTAKDDYDAASSGPYSNWGCDYLVSMDEATDAYSIGLYGCYGGWSNGLLVSFLNPVTVEAGKKLPLLGSMATIPWTYKDIVNFVGTFDCGAYNLSPENVGKTLTVQLVIWDQDNGTIDDPVVVKKIEYTFTDYIPLVKDNTRYFYKSSGYDANSYTLDGNGNLTQLKSESEGPHFAPAVAQIGDNYYASLADAIAAVPTDGTATTITMIADETVSNVGNGWLSIAATKNIVLDLNGHVISGVSDQKSAYFIKNYGELEIVDSGENGKITFSAVADPGYSKENITIYNNGGTLTLTSGKIENTTDGGATYAVNNSSNAWGNGDDKDSIFNMNGGIISAPKGDAALRVYQNCSKWANPYSHNTVNITGGTILDTGIFLDSYIYQPDANTTGVQIITTVNISGGEIHGLIDLKLRHPFNTSLNITNGTFVDSKLRVRKHSEWNNVLSEPTDPIVTISGGKWSFVSSANSAFNVSSGWTTTSTWTTFKPYKVTGGVFNVDLNNYSGIEFESGNTGVANSGANKATYPYTVGVAVAQIGTTKYASLYDAAAAVKNGDTITMIANTLETNEVKFEFSGSATLDLNGFTVATNEDIWVKTGNLTVVGSEGSKVTSLGENSNGYGFYVSTTSLATNEATLTIDSDNVTVDAEKYGVVLMTNGVFNLVKGHIVSHSNFAVTGNGTAPNVTVNISGGSIESSKTAIYFPATASLNIMGGTITGTTAIYQKCGTLTITGGTIRATGEAAEYSFNGNGANPTGDAIVIDNCGYPSGAPSANISGAEITSEHGKQIGYYVYGTSAEGTVLAGSAYTLNTNTEKEWVADTSVTGYSYRIATPTYVAQIGETKYTSLADAIAAANADTTSDSITITLLEDIDFSTEEYAGYKWAGSTYNPLTITRSNVTIDLNGRTISEMGNAALVFGNLLAKDGRIANITIMNGTLRAGKTDNVTNSYVLGIAGVDGVLVKNITTMGGINVYTGSKNVVIDSCNVAGTKYYTVCAQCGSDVTIKGTTYTKNTDSTVANKSMFWIQGAGTDSDMATDGNPTGAFGTSSITIESGNFTVDTSNGGVFYLGSGVKPIVKGGYFNIDPTAYVADGYAAVTSDLAGYTHKVVPYVEQSTTTAEATTTTTDVQSGTTTTTTTTTNLATAENGDNTQYVIKIETTTVTTSTSNPEDTTEDTNTVYKPVTVGVTSNNNVDEYVEVTAENLNASTGTIEGAKQTVEEAVTEQTATFKAKLDVNSGTSSANVLKTTAAANAIAKAAAKVGAAGKTGEITDAKIELKTTLKSYTLADGTNSSVKATKVVYDIKPVAVIYNGSEQLGTVELDNADIKEGETFTFTIPVPANMTASTVKVSHIGTNGYSTEIGTYHVDGTGNNRYVTVTVDHFSKFELEETTVAIDGNCKITAAIALDDSININFYVQSLASGTSKENYKVVYSFNGKTETTAYGASWVETVNGSGKYFFKVAECAASQMNDKVSFKVYYNDGYNDVEIKSISYSIRDYCVNMIKKNSNQKLVELCRAVLDYGAAAQNYFNYNKANLANAGGYGLASPVTEIPSEFNALDVHRENDISKLTASLNTVSKTEINFYITASSVTDVTVKLGTTPVEGVVTEQLSDGRYKVTIKGIAAAHLNNVYTLTFKTAVGRTSTLSYSALTYSYGKQSSQTAGKLSLAIYNYYLKAAAYFS